METTTITGQYLTFTLETELFAVSVQRVREVLEMTPITKVPKAPPFIIGVINLRGSVIPVMDLGIKFGLQARPATMNTSIIVMEWDLGSETVVIGTIVDSVHEVVEFGDAEIQPPPRFGNQFQTEYLLGMGAKNGAFIMIINMDKVFSEKEILQMKLQESAP